MPEDIDSSLSMPHAGAPARPGRLWVLWLLFFFQFAAVGIYFTFLNVYYKQAGLSGSQIGLIGMAGGIVGIAGTFLWSYLSDRTGQPRLLIAAGALGGLLTAQTIPLVGILGLANAFWLYMAIGCAGSLMTSSVNTLVDSTTLAMLGESRQAYGRYRLGGSVGYIVGTIAAGFLYDQVGYLWMFPAYGLLMLAFAWLALKLPRRAARLAGAGGREIAQMIRQPTWLILIATAFLFWVANYALIAFQGVVLKSMGADDKLIAFAAVIGTVIEVPFMAFSERLIQRFGAARLLCFALLLQVIRFFLLSQMGAPEWAIAINMLNGPGFVLFWTSAVNLVSRLAPPSLVATAQGFFASTISLASIVSSLLGGVLFDQLGPSGLFLALTAICLAAFVLYSLGIVLRPQPERSPIAPVAQSDH
jgi:PPP family 3-phenylpropionic acid transporter